MATGKGLPRSLKNAAPQVPAAATTAAVGGVKKMPTQAASVAADVPGLVTDFNALLVKLKAAGIMS